MTARCPFCEAVHPTAAGPERTGERLDCPCGATTLLRAPNAEPETSVRRNMIAANKILGLSVLGGFIYLVGWTVHRISAALNVSLDPGARTTTSYVLIYLVGVVSTAAFARFVWGPSLWDHVARYWTKRKRALMGFAATSAMTMLVASALAFLMLILLGTPIWSAAVLQSVSLRRVTISDPSWIGAMLVAIVEEVTFRGIIFNYLRLGTGPWKMPQALVGSALIFGLAHQVRGPLYLFSLQDIPMLVGLTLLGVLLAVAYAVSGSLACAIGIHTGLLWVNILGGRTHLAGWLWLRVSSAGGGSTDLRAQPWVWALFDGLTVGCWFARRWLRRFAAVED